MSSRSILSGAGVIALALPFFFAAGVEAATVLTVNDGVVKNSLCVGFDCPNNPTFSDSTILLTENNTRIKFDDTSVAASFPRNDWELQANSSFNGGGNFFAINDCGESVGGGCADDPVFKVEAGARANALYVESDGDVGFGTNNPAVILHAKEGNTPTLRLEQDGTSGFTPQVWDVAGNETNFFVRDATGGSALPFRIKPGTPSNTVMLTADDQGRVGMGTSSPDTALHVRRTDGTAKFHVEDTAGTAANRSMMELENNGGIFFDLINNSANETWRMFNTLVGRFQIQNGMANLEFFPGGDVEIDRDDGTKIFDLSGPTGNLDILGAYGMISDRAAKTDIAPIDGSDYLRQVAELPLSTWSYKHDVGVKHVGPMAQDFYAAFGLDRGDTRISISDLSGVALAAIQGLNTRVEELQAEVAQLHLLLANTVSD